MFVSCFLFKLLKSINKANRFKVCIVFRSVLLKSAWYKYIYWGGYLDWDQKLTMYNCIHLLSVLLSLKSLLLGIMLSKLKVNLFIYFFKKTNRTQDLKTKKHHIPVVDRTPLEPPPIVVVVMGPPKVGKSTLIQCLIRNFTRQKLTEIRGPVTIVSGKRCCHRLAWQVSSRGHACLCWTLSWLVNVKVILLLHVTALVLLLWL